MPSLETPYLEAMATRIIQFGIAPSSILTALAGNGYNVDACGTSITKLKQALQQPDEGKRTPMAVWTSP